MTTGAIAASTSVETLTGFVWRPSYDCACRRRNSHFGDLWPLPFWLAYHCNQSSAVQSMRSIPTGSTVGVRFFFGRLAMVKPRGSGIARGQFAVGRGQLAVVLRPAVGPRVAVR